MVFEKMVFFFLFFFFFSFLFYWFFNFLFFFPLPASFFFFFFFFFFSTKYEWGSKFIFHSFKRWWHGVRKDGFSFRYSRFIFLFRSMDFTHNLIRCVRSAKVTRVKKEDIIYVVYVQIDFLVEGVVGRKLAAFPCCSGGTFRKSAEQLPKLDVNLPSMNDPSSEISGLEWMRKSVLRFGQDESYICRIFKTKSLRCLEMIIRI